MSALRTELNLSRTQATVLGDENVQRFTDFMRNKCSKAFGGACSLEVEVAQAGRSACVSCANCSVPAAQSFAATELPSLANAIILNTDLVQEPDPDINLSHLRMVEALDESFMAHKHAGTVAVGLAATAVEPIGYARTISDPQVLFPVTSIEGQGAAIEPGQPVLIEFPEPKVQS